MRGDRTMLGQVVMNLCLNARDAMPTGGTLSVDVERTSEDEVLLRVRDTGTGIAPDDLPHISSRSSRRGSGARRLASAWRRSLVP